MGDGLRLTLRWVADAVGGRIRAGDPDMEIRTVGIDTRALQPGDFFVALRGARFDAHEFIDEAFRKGAAGAIVERRFRGGPEGAAIVEVDDTTRALQDLGHAVRVASGARVVAITGSAGKTTTKEAIAEFLSVRFRVVKNRGNLNNHIGLPLSLLQLRERPDVAVMELGMNHPGEISTLVAIAEPEVRVWTNVGDAHIGYFGSSDAIADAKAEILERAGAGHVLVCNADDPRVMARARRFGGKVVTFGTAAAADVRAREVEDLGIDGMRARVHTAAGERTVATALLGRGNLDNVLAATAVALEFGVPLDSIASAAARLAPADRRGAVRRLRGGVVLIDDSYNSSPAALGRALEVVAKEAHTARKVAVVGEMLELGDQAIALHRQSGRTAAGAELRLLVAIGGEPARALAAAAVEAGMPASAVRHFDTSEAAAPATAAEIRAGDLVLVKGSRATRTDIVADAIAAEFS
ncbi:MAG: UDP-N-acetylmuramoyl-tripeptide--D-alanyl-D-alanine ligase [Acidobacteria bacterium]|nr:UDP-N-acetylmuramoyl-tripeptide--D-alanyl-D-alanine ligase [Acidobacteriota bacterium]